MLKCAQKNKIIVLCAEVGECVMILADRMLLDLPLEALEVLQSDGIVSVSRDFSLQVLHARLQSDEAGESFSEKLSLS